MGRYYHYLHLHTTWHIYIHIIEKHIHKPITISYCLYICTLLTMYTYILVHNTRTGHYTCIYIPTYVHAYSKVAGGALVCKPLHTIVNLCTNLEALTYRHNIHIHIHICMHACMREYKHSVHTYTHTYIYACMNAWMHTYIHTYKKQTCISAMHTLTCTYILNIHIHT